VRVLVVDDNERWRRFFSTTLRKQPELQVLGEVSDGLEAVRQAQQLRPDLILLDIGLPTLNGIQAAGRIREVSPNSKILFVSENRSRDVVEEALRTGAGGYVVKSDAASELLPAVKAVLDRKKFVSASLTGHNLADPVDDRSDNFQREKIVAPFPAERKIRHEVEFYADDAEFVDGFARFIEAELKEGNAVIVIATDSHAASLLQRLTADGLNMCAEIEQGNYIPFEVTNTLSSFMVNDAPDPVLFRSLAGNLIQTAKRAKGEGSLVAACGEGVHSLLTAGNLDATIALERLWSEMAELYDVDILCGYFQSDFATNEDISTLERVCAEHTTVRGRELCY
jgi:DNA-binding NarL/FixJ family response regulator